ncbi:MAG: PDZ domain-containing protein [Prevotellaceae bacterium]|jgi:carboxyl-terminal processing protease|nr:PDZ domain-containing protein [Prevotellaceae bacterium]
MQARNTSLFLVALLVSIGVQAQPGGRNAARKLQMAEFAIANLYVDTVNEGRLVEKAIVAMLGDLDPHSVYNNAEEVKKMNEPLEGNFEGIGVQFQMVEDTLLVIQPVSGGPSEKAGIAAGDRITAVNGAPIAGVKMSTDEIMSRLRGPKGTTVNLTVVRREVKAPLAFTVKRDKIPIHSLDAAYMIQPRTGYIRVNRFSATTTEEFLAALQKLQKAGMRSLILDLQGNGGGLLNAATEMAEQLLDEGELIVYTEGRRAGRNDFKAKGNGHFRNGELVVLVDEYSASASEIVTGAVQDWDRGVVVGRRTFGKGLVQRAIPLEDGSMIRLTVARYYTPSGRCIQKPYEAGDGEGKEEYAYDLVERFNRGEMMHADSIHFPDSLKYSTLKLHRTVYGGGGIMPDYFVPLDTARYTDYHRALAAQGIINKSVTKYVEQQRKTLQARYKTFAPYRDGFEVPDTLLDDLLAEAGEAGIAFDRAQYERSLPLIKNQLKALIARDLWDISEYYEVINRTDESVQQALKLLDERRYNDLLSTTVRRTATD